MDKIIKVCVAEINYNGWPPQTCSRQATHGNYCWQHKIKPVGNPTLLAARIKVAVECGDTPEIWGYDGDG